MEKETKHLKEVYVPPRLQVVNILMENSLAASSANVIPGDSYGSGIDHEWKPGEDKKWEIEW
ncbi:hypothetical protein [uncultured Sphingobacterium sp.]|uniref:hypothetical protein n=1 Tax=uncultured Sphingobacterium sp. TaxID=182688 RepID=UPI0025CBE76B|nr:hypothetical protein [uncultured Sphingobacterium sp.]